MDENILYRILEGLIVMIIGLGIMGYFLGSFDYVMSTYDGWNKLIIGLVLCICIASPIYYVYKRAANKEIRIE